MKLILGILLLIFVYIIGWHQLYGQFIHEFYKKYQYWLSLLSIPTTIISVYAARILSESFDGKMWPNRILTFCIGMIMFSILTLFYFDEKLTIKTTTLLFLTLLIVILQIIWK
jgi:hypothetical protein